VSGLSDEELARADISAGVRVVEASGAAAEAGVRSGDIITRLNHKAVTNADQLDEISDGLTPGRTVPMLVLRDSSPVFLALRVPD
jgi:serine protease Do